MSYVFGKKLIGYRLSFLKFLLGLVLISCGHSEKELSNNPELLWNLGMEAFDRGSWMDARKHFQRFDRYFPQDNRASLAKLRMADTHFGEGKYFEAEVHFQSFIELYPKHPEVGYAWYRLGLSQKHQAPGIVARDLKKAKEAQKSFRTFLELPGGDAQLQLIAQHHIQELDHRLMQQEFEIGSWYFKLGHFKSAYLRFQYVLNTFLYLRKDREQDLYTAADRMLHCAISLKDRVLLQQAVELFAVFKDHPEYPTVMKKVGEIDTTQWSENST